MDKNLRDEIFDFLEGRENPKKSGGSVAGGILRLALKRDVTFSQEEREEILRRIDEKIAGGPFIEAEEPLEEKK